MHWTQLAYLGLLAVAIIAGRPRPVLAAVMLGNFIATVIFAGASNFIAVAFADLACAVVILAHEIRFSAERRSMIVAGLFGAMLPVYVAADIFDLSRATTFAIVEVFAYTQLAVIGNVDGGLRKVGRALWSFVLGGHNRVAGAVASRNDTPRHHPAYSPQGKG